MPSLRIASEVLRYRAVLEESGRFQGFIKWKREAAEAVREYLSNHTLRAIEILISEHRDEVDQTEENRPDYCDLYPYHYDFRIPINGELIYIETVFEPGITEDDSSIRIVRVKPANPDRPWISTKP
jgi:hypothetical protein